MKRRYVFYIFFLCFMTLTFYVSGVSKDIKIDSIWASSPVKIDGLNSEWEGDTLAFEKKVKVNYAFRNDAENLYVLFIFNAPEFMSSIRQTGMTVWLNAEGEKKKDYGIKFNMQMIAADVYISLLEKKMGPLPEEKKKEIKARPAYPLFKNEVIDKKGEDFVISSGPSAPVFNSKQGKNMTVYEFRIPLKKGEGQPVGIGADPGKNIKVGFEWGGMTKEMREERMKQLGASSAKAREGGATGSLTAERRAGGDSAPLSSIRRGAKKYSFWTDVSLAQNK